MGRAHGGLAEISCGLRSGSRQANDQQRHASTHIDAPPAAVLSALSDPEAVCRWFPLPCEFDEDVSHLEAGCSYATTGKLAGQKIHSQLEVREASKRAVSVRLSGPVALSLDADLRPAEGGTDLRVRISVGSGGGITGRLLAPAASAVLNGALGHTLNAIRKEAESH